MPCNCRGFFAEQPHLPVDAPNDEVVLPMRYQHIACSGSGLGWYEYVWEEALADELIRERYAHVLDVEIIEHVTWMQAIEMVAGYRPADDADECASLGV